MSETKGSRGTGGSDETEAGGGESPEAKDPTRFADEHVDSSGRNDDDGINVIVGMEHAPASPQVSSAPPTGGENIRGAGPGVGRSKRMYIRPGNGGAGGPKGPRASKKQESLVTNTPPTGLAGGLGAGGATTPIVSVAPTVPIVTYKACTHRGNIAIIALKSGKTIYGGGISKGAYAEGGMFLIDLTSTKSAQSMCKTMETTSKNELVLQFVKDWGSVDYLNIPVIDGSAPAYPRKFWEQLFEMIKSLNKNVLIVCQGGHGRTGTVLSILLGLFCDVTDPVQKCREIYCEDAVETNAQLDYIEEITGLKTKCIVRAVAVTYQSSYAPGRVWDPKAGTYKDIGYGSVP